MISIFNGRQRRLGEASKDEIFVKVEVSLRDNLHHFKPAEFMVFMAIALRIDEDGECFPSYDQLQEDTGLTRPTVAKAVKGLAELKIDDHPVLSIRREHDARGRFVGNNIYCVFPSTDQSKENPTLVTSNFSKSILEEETVRRKEEPITKKTNGVAANDTPPAPSQPKAIDHPYVQAYREVFQRYPAKAQIAKIAKMIVTPPGTARFTAACEAWLMRGYNVTRLDGILEWYRDGIPSYQNGKNRRRTTVPAEPYQPPTEAERAAYIAAAEPLEF